MEQIIPRDRKQKAEARPWAAAPKPELSKRSTLGGSKDEEASFPRGSGSILNSLEFKQISNAAAKDARFEADNVKAKSDKKKPRREGLKERKIKELKRTNPRRVNKGGLKQRD